MKLSTQKPWSGWQRGVVVNPFAVMGWPMTPLSMVLEPPLIFHPSIWRRYHQQLGAAVRDYQLPARWRGPAPHPYSRFLAMFKVTEPDLTSSPNTLEAVSTPRFLG